jgi:hypothetical protein
MGKAKRKDERGPIQKLEDRERMERDTAPLVNEFAEANGDYERNLRFVVNRGGTPIARWIKANLLSESQQAGILHCVNLWSKLGSRSVVVNFDRVRGQPHGDGLSEHEALAELHRIKHTFPAHYWDVFEGVCRFDLPAGTSWSGITAPKHSIETTARTIVCFVADTIAMRERLTF